MGDDFSKVGSQVSELLQSYLFQSADENTPVVPWIGREELAASYSQLLSEKGGEPIAKTLQLFLERSTKLHSPKNMGHQIAVPDPIASYFEWAAGLLNQGSAIYEVGPSSNAMERAIVLRLLEMVGFTSGEGVATHGGTVGNLTALLTARNVCFPNSWEEGNGEPGVILSGADSHYSISRAAGILGLGTNQIVKVALDSRRCMDVDDLEKQIKKLREKNRKIIAVIAASGTTAVGAFDPLSEIATLCVREGLWLHVDGAHGASVLMSEKLRPLVNGIERADSIVWDAHKLLGVAGLCTFILYRDRKNAFRAFSQDAPYLFNENDPIEIDAAHKTMECTRRALAVPLFGLWALKGSGWFASHMETLFATTKKFHEHLKVTSDFETVHEPQCNILCFRYRPFGEDQRELRRRVVQRGNYYLTQAMLDGRGMLRVTISNAKTGMKELVGLLEEIREVGQKV